MSMLQSYSDFLGKNDSVEFTRQYNEFLTAARSIRRQLGGQAHIFDKYLYDVFLAFNTITPSTAADEGFEAGAELRGIITDILTGENKEQEHPYYQTAKNYIDRHPLPQMNDMMKSIIYISALSADFFPQSVLSFTERWAKVIQEEIGSDKGDFIEIYESICAALGGSSQMDELNRLMRECFMTPSATGIYTQGYWISLSSSFVYQENGRSAIQLLLEMDE